jgi:glyoxylase-like metal-dependent hydrolase (beta-lactamase superfamily II)/rhodanese-related sulfurtransferase
VYFKQFLHDDLGCSSYFVASRESREAAVVDPQRDIEPYLALAHERGYTITRVIDTHLHADHVSGNRKLAAATGAHLHLHESADVLFPFEPLRDGEEVPVGQLRLKVVHTPGHRPEMISLLVVNPARSPEPSMVLTGDALFVGDVGRPDFGGPEGAAQEFESIQRLLQLPDYVEVFPAHFEGSCGKGMCGRPSTTIGFERRFNPVVQLPREEFVRAAIMDANRGVAEYAFAPVGHDVDVAEVAAADAPGWLAKHPRARIIDVREQEEWAAGHLSGAALLPQADLASRLDELPHDEDLLVVCAGGVRSRRATGFLQGAGFERVFSLEGGTDAWREAGQPLDR